MSSIINESFNPSYAKTIVSATHECSECHKEAKIRLAPCDSSNYTACSSKLKKEIFNIIISVVDNIHKTCESLSPEDKINVRLEMINHIKEELKSIFNFYLK